MSGKNACWLALAIAVAAQGQDLRLVRGQVSDATETSLIIRDTFLKPSKCSLNAATEKLQANGTSPGPAIANGAYVEAIVEQTGDACTIRTIYIRPPRPPIQVSSVRGQSMLDNLFPRGNLVYTGTVQLLTERHLRLRSRKGERWEFTIRNDTLFSTGGRLVNQNTLEPQTVVQVRAGKAFSGELEVYQVTWGDILPGSQ